MAEGKTEGKLTERRKRPLRLFFVLTFALGKLADSIHQNIVETKKKKKKMIAKNNIFNIRTGAKWKGMTGAKNGFVEFETREYGIRAWIVLMHNYRVKHRCATVRAIITRFAPPSENQTQAYIKYCRERVYKSEITWLTTTADYVRLGCAMAKMETNTVLTAQEIYDVMQKFNVTFLSDKEINNLD